MSETFTLQNAPPKTFKKTPPPFAPEARQGVLFTGLDCLPGQQELFDKPPERPIIVKRPKPSPDCNCGICRSFRNGNRR